MSGFVIDHATRADKRLTVRRLYRRWLHSQWLVLAATLGLATGAVVMDTVRAGQFSVMRAELASVTAERDQLRRAEAVRAAEAERERCTEFREGGRRYRWCRLDALAPGRDS